MLTNRILKFFSEQAKKDPERYHAFYEDYGLFFREGIVTSPEQETRVIHHGSWYKLYPDNYFFISPQKYMLWFSLEAPPWGASNEYS